MPARITKNKTDNQNGEISVSDVHRLLNDYAKKINLTCSDPSRNPVSKHFYFDIDKVQIDAITNGTKNPDSNPDRFRIHLVLNLPGQLNCTETASIENYLSILVCGINNNLENKGASLLEVDKLVLAEGFKDEDKIHFADTCCVQGDPPPTP